MEINSIDELVKLAGLVKQQELATEAEVEEDCGCADEPQPVMTNNPNMYAILQRLAQMGEVHEDEVTEEWANSTEHFDGEDRITDLPKGEPVDTSLRRHLGANAQPVRVEEGIQDHTVEDMMESYAAFKLNEATKGCADCEYMKDETDGEIDTCDECAAEERAEARKANEQAVVTENAERIIKVSNIDYAGPALDKLPTETTLKLNIPYNADEDDIYDMVADELEDRHGVKVDGFDMNFVEAEVEEDNAFNTAAAAAKKAGKSEFEFNGKKYKVKMDAKTADALTDDIDMLRKLAGM